jgi:tetratricopeptide (TPR) repeat protein
MYERTGDRVEHGAALAGLGQLLALFGSTDEAAEVLGAARRVLDGTGATRRLGTCAIAYGMLYTSLARWDAARDEYALAVSLFQSIGADRMATAALYNMADLLWNAGALEEAIETVRNSLALARRCGALSFIGASAGSLAGMLIERGALDEAAAVAREAIPVCREDEYVDWLFDHLALRAAKGGRMDDAARLLGYAGRNGAERQTAELRAVETLKDILGRHLAPERLGRLTAEGRLLGDDQATELALRP